MVILKDGDAQAALKPKRFLCGKCGFYFEANMEEYITGTQWDQAAWCECPVCGNIVYEQ